MGKRILWVVLLLTLTAVAASASEADIKIPPLDTVSFNVMGKAISGMAILYIGLVICAIGVVFGLVQYKQTKDLAVHESMRDGVEHDLGDVQNLSLSAGQISRRSSGC